LRLLLDTHALLWWLLGDRRLSRELCGVIADPNSVVHVSAANFWEISIKESLGRLDLRGVDLETEVQADGFVELPILSRHALAAGRLPRHHDDAFDRMLIAQARTENLTLLSLDRAFRDYDVQLLPI